MLGSLKDMAKQLNKCHFLVTLLEIFWPFRVVIALDSLRKAPFPLNMVVFMFSFVVVIIIIIFLIC